MALAKFQTEELLSSSEELYRSLLDNMLNGFAYCRMLFPEDQPPDFIFLAVNGVFTTLTGLKDVVGKKATEVIPGILELDPGLFEIYGRVALSGNPERVEMYVASLRMWFLAISVQPQKRTLCVCIRRYHRTQADRTAAAGKQRENQSDPEFYCRGLYGLDLMGHCTFFNPF